MSRVVGWAANLVGGRGEHAMRGHDERQAKRVTLQAVLALVGLT